jgi:hypothetical protein
MHEVLEVFRAWQQGWGGLTQDRLTSGRHIIEDISVLLFKRRHDSHHRFDKPRALGTLGPKATLAPEHTLTHGPLRRVVRRLHLGMAHKRPQRLAYLEDRPADSFGLGRPTGLTGFEQPLHLLPGRSPVAGKAGRRQRASTQPMPAVEHLACLRPQRLFDLLRAPPARSWLRSLAADAPNRAAAAT